MLNTVVLVVEFLAKGCKIIIGFWLTLELWGMSGHLLKLITYLQKNTFFKAHTRSVQVFISFAY